MIKLIVSDIDGTLVEDGGNQIDSELLDTILRLRKSGVQFAAASGRQWCSIEALFDPIKEKIFYLSDNGAYVGCHGRNLFVYPIERGTALEVIRDIRAAGLEMTVSGPDAIYVDTKDEQLLEWLIDGYRFRVIQVEDLTDVQDDIIKISAYKKERIEDSAGHLWQAYRDKLKITIAGDMWMDFMTPGVSKGAAVGQLQESLGIGKNETMVFGDQLNDLEMLSQAYYSFAVGNARDEVKGAARFQTDENTKNGVLKILKLLV